MAIAQIYTERTCIRCSSLKDDSEFVPWRKNKTRPTGWCRDCWLEYGREQARKRRLTKPDEVSRSRRKYYAKHSGKIRLRVKSYYDANKEELNAKKKVYRDNNASKTKDYSDTYRVENNHKKKAQSKVRIAVKNGTLTKESCVACLVNNGMIVEEVHGHHQDYDLPLNVIWLCRKHHSEVHRKDFIL